MEFNVTNQIKTRLMLHGENRVPVSSGDQIRILTEGDNFTIYAIFRKSDQLYFETAGPLNVGETRFPENLEGLKRWYENCSSLTFDIESPDTTESSSPCYTLVPMEFKV